MCVLQIKPRSLCFYISLPGVPFAGSANICYQQTPTFEGFQAIKRLHRITKMDVAFVLQTNSADLHWKVLEQVKNIRVTKSTLGDF